MEVTLTHSFGRRCSSPLRECPIVLRRPSTPSSPLFSTRSTTPSRWIWISLRERGEGEWSNCSNHELTLREHALFLKRAKPSEKVTTFCPPHFLRVEKRKKIWHYVTFQIDRSFKFLRRRNLENINKRLSRRILFWIFLNFCISVS